MRHLLVVDNASPFYPPYPEGLGLAEVVSVHSSEVVEIDEDLEVVHGGLGYTDQ